MKIKGLGEVKPLGRITVDPESCWYFYYLLDDKSLVELEVSLDTDERRFSRKVTAFLPQFAGSEQLLAS